MTGAAGRSLSRRIQDRGDGPHRGGNVSMAEITCVEFDGTL